MKQLRKRRGIAILMSLAMAFTMMPIMGTPVYADDPAPAAICLANGGAPNIEGGQKHSIYFGNYPQSEVSNVDGLTKDVDYIEVGNKKYLIEPVKWRVLDNPVDVNGLPLNKLLLLSDQNLDCKQYHEQPTSITWKDSTIRDWLNDVKDGFMKDAFSEDEQKAIAATKVQNALTDKYTPNPDYPTVDGGSDTEDQVFLLSIEEATNEKYGFITNNYNVTPTREAKNTAYAKARGAYDNVGKGDWWLRSPGFYNNDAAVVLTDSHLDSDGNHVDVDNRAARPALNLNLSSVLFTSAAVGGKSSGTVGAESLTQIGENASNEWKLTVKDDTHKNFKVDSVTTSDGKNLTIKYSGAKKADNEYISAIIKSSNGDLKYYGRLALASDEDGSTVSVNTEGKLGDGDTLYIFNEQCNGNYKTDFSSPLRTIHSWELVSFGGDKVEGKKPGETGHIKFHLNYKCSCGDPEDYKVEKGAHTTVLERTDEYKIEIKTKPTCTEDGTYTYWFKGTDLDGSSYDKGIDTPAPATGHNMTPHTAAQPTCTEDGTVEYWSCGNCNKNFGDAQGSTELTTVVDQKTGHKYCEWKNLDANQHQRVCEHDATHVEKSNHSWDAGKVTKAATEKAEGVKTFTCTVCKATKTETIPKLKPSAPKVSGTPLAKMTAKKKSITISWNKIRGAAGYDIFFARCNHSNKKIVTKKAKTIKGNKTFKWTKSELKKGTAYKAYVRAYVYKNGKKTYVRSSPLMHAYTGNGTKNYTNAKSVSVNKAKVTLKKGKTFKIKAKVKKVKKNKKLMPKSHAPTLRYLTSNKKVATVSKSGKIKARGKGACSVYVFAHNGVSKTIKVTVK